ncbi:MAG TPA: hypothetical protein VFS43_05525 [Polyangiaceae bacterium]|nr:hypothetical protein [Polyangiaceae bacterium]
MRPLALALALAAFSSCSPGPKGEGPRPPGPAASAPRPAGGSAAPAKPVLRTFLRGCNDYRLSALEGGSFVHVGVIEPLLNVPGARTPAALHVLPDGSIDRPSSTRAERLFGRFPERAWAQPPPAQWRQGRWEAIKAPEGVTPVAWLPWAGGRVVLVGKRAGGGTAVLLEDTGAPPEGFVAPAELSRLEPRSAISLPEAPALVIHGTLNDDPSYVAVAGSVRALLKNDAGDSIYALPPHPRDRLLFAHRPPAGKPRVVRIAHDRLTPAEPFPVAPVALAADDAGVEWLLSNDGELFRHEPPGAAWAPVAQVSALGLRRLPTLAPGQGGLWLSFRGGVFFARDDGEIESIPLPPEIDAGLASVDVLGVDHEGRVWAGAWVGARATSYLLTSGPVPAALSCDEALRGL